MLAGLSHAMVSRVEKGERLPTIDTLLRISEALGVDLGKLIRNAVKSVKKESELSLRESNSADFQP